MSGIYIHIPFCKQACSYCDFHFSTNHQTKTDLISAIAEEIKLRSNYLNNPKLESIYFGGGTPSLLTEEELNVLLIQLSHYYHWDESAEITLEANPDDINRKNLKIWQSLGINRLSIGLQSFHDEELKWMNRAHTAAESEDCVKMAQEMGFHNISFDLIYGSKFQNQKTWNDTLIKAISLNTPHVSAYNLTIEGKTKLSHQLAKGQEPAVDADLSSWQFEKMLEVFSLHGIEQYEISNFAKENFIAIHNTNYWLQKPYLGLGPSAHSYNGVSRQWNIKNNALYIKNLKEDKNYFEIENLSTKDLYNEYVLTRLRTKWGIDEADFKNRFGDRMLLDFKTDVSKMQKHFIQQAGNIQLNQTGKLLADQIASDLFIL